MSDCPKEILAVKPATCGGAAVIAFAKVIPFSPLSPQRGERARVRGDMN
jgi:hypothetical protein